jgi:hypothetical protein
MVSIGDHTGEDVEATGRALGVRLCAHTLRQVQLLDQGHQVRTIALQHCSIAQVDPLESEAVDLLLDSRIDVGQEGAPQGPGEVAESQIDAGRLHGLGSDSVVAGANPFGLDRLI